MSHGHDEGPVYYREIQKNAYLKRIPNESGGSKLRPLGHKKPPLKPMWTLFCVHNGRSPYLEQYPLAESPATLSHKPVWRACLRTARHVTASVKPHSGLEYDFLIDTDHGPVRMIAPDWESMQDWVTTLRNKLHELRILSKGENVYCAAPAAPAPRAAARDPTSPLPPTPPVPPDRVPGIELAPPARAPPADPPPPTPVPDPPQPIDISSWDETTPVPSTSQESEPKKSVAKICGQNICLDDSILKRNVDTTDSDEEFFSELDRATGSVERLQIDNNYKQTVVVADEVATAADNQSDRQATNITVIQVSNKPPHTAIPVLGPETDIFDFNFTQNPENNTETSFVNIVNTEVNVNSENGYGTVFMDDYGHLSLTTTVNLTDVNDSSTDKNGVYERLCLASTSNEAVTKLKKLDRARKSSLPNLETSNCDTTYEYLYPSQNQNQNTNTAVTVNGETQNQNGRVEVNSTQNGRVEVNSDSNGRVEVNNSVDRSQNAVTVAGNVSFNTRAARSNVERSHSQNAYDSPRRDSVRRVNNLSPKREGSNDRDNSEAAKPIWRRGLTELSLLTRLRSLARKNSPPPHDRSGAAPTKVVRRSRPEARPDAARRRSSSLSNGQSQPPTPLVPLRVRQARLLAAEQRACAAVAAAAPHHAPPVLAQHADQLCSEATASATRQLRPLPGQSQPPTPLVPLRVRQARLLAAEQRACAAVAAAAPHHAPPVLAQHADQLWIAWWAVGGSRCSGRAGDRLAAIRGTQPRDLQHARQLFKTSPTPIVDILFHRVPLAKIYVLTKKDRESIGIKLDVECNIVSVENQSPAARAGIPPPGKWAVTEVNNRPINLIKGGDEEMNRLCMHGTEVSVLIQPSALVKKLRAAIKANKHLLSMR